jgi:hypothetical protein
MEERLAALEAHVAALTAPFPFGIASAVVETESGLSILIAMLAVELHKSGALDKGEFTKTIRKAVKEAEKQLLENPASRRGHDLFLMQHVANVIDGHGKKKGWNPIVIEGGATPDPDGPD